MGSLTSAMLSSDEEAGTSEELLGQQSTRKFEATFLNGKEIEVEYTYEREGLDGIRIRINLQALLPVLGGIISPDTRKFVSIFHVKDLLKTNPNLHECSVYGLYNSCFNLDGGLEEGGDKCPHDHFHHYCPEHVNAWFKYYLTVAIILREGDYAELVKLSNPKDADYLTTEIRSNARYWLRRAQRQRCRFSRETPQEILQRLSTHKFRATFLNGKEIEVEYIYHREGLERLRIAVNLQGLLPVLGGFISTDAKKFVSPFHVKDLLKTNPNLHECSVYGLYNSCFNLDESLEEEGDTCPYDHFHHYCPEHVNAWFKYYLTVAIILREGDYVEVVKLSNPQDADYLTTEIRSTAEYWLRYARRKECGFSRKQLQSNYSV